MSALYDSDFCEWVEQQKVFLKEKAFEHLDIEHLLEEMNDMGKADRRSIESHLEIALIHFLKQKYQPDYSSKSWQDSIYNAIVQIDNIIENSPSLKNHPKICLEKCYVRARRYAAKQTKLDINIFPKECPWTLEEILGE